MISEEENEDRTMDISENAPMGMNRQNPDKEESYLNEEYLFHDPTKPFGRVLSFFEFRLHGQPVVINPDSIAPDGSGDIEVVGMVGTIYHKEGLFGQCGWFGNFDLDWFWARITGIRALKVASDIRFRRGEQCVWLYTKLGEYAMLLPHETYRDAWEETVHGLGSGALSALFRQWPAHGVRPTWWPDRWKDEWPFEREAGSKRRASMDVQEHEATTRQLGPATDSWSLIGARGEIGNQGQMWTNLDHRSAWLLEPSGAVSTASLTSNNETDIEPDTPVNDFPAQKRLRRKSRAD